MQFIPVHSKFSFCRFISFLLHSHQHILKGNSLKTFFLLLCTIPLLAQQKVEYTISFPNAVHHEAEVSISFSGITTKTLEVRMSRSSTGRYALHEFAKNVYNVKAFDEHHQPLIISRPNPHQWNIAQKGGTVVFSYTVYGDRIDGTYLEIDNEHAHINMPAAFMWARGFENAPITIQFIPPKQSRWKIATQLKPTTDSLIFTAPNFQYFMDSPTELSNFALRTWNVGSGKTAKTFRLTIHQNDSDNYVDAYAKIVQTIVQEEEGIWNAFAPFDYGTYTFLADYLPNANGDGMEHRNSTVITSSRTLKKDAVALAGTVAHEFFHSWNVKRIRPRSLEPFNFEDANMSGELWFAEGFTSYYASLVMKRAGLVSLDNFARSLSFPVGAALNTNALKYFSPVELSMQAPFVDAATAIDENNRTNTYLSYYTIGSAIAVGLDLTLRSQYNLTLDDFMRAVWKEHRDINKPYTNEDLERILGVLTKDKKFAEEFFHNYIFGNNLPDYHELLKHAGLTLRKAHPDKASLGAIFFQEDSGKVSLQGATLVGSSLYNAGLDRDDRIMEIDTMKITSRKDIDTLLTFHHPHDTLSIIFKQRGKTVTSKIILDEDSRWEIVPFEKDSLVVTEAVKTFRTLWLKSYAKEPPLQVLKWCPKCKRSYEFTKEKCDADKERLSIALDGE